MKYAWKPDVPDHRDRYFAIPGQITLPKTVSRIGLKNQIEDQGNLGSCTGNASTSALEIVAGIPAQLSRLMAYYNARQIDGTTSYDAGAYIRSAIKGLMKIGVSTEEIWPYVIAKYRNKPSADAYADATRLINSLSGKYEYVRLTTLQDVKYALAQRQPVVFGFVVTQAFEEMTSSYFLKTPTNNDPVLGGHAVVAVGYNDTVKSRYIWVRNSWGNSWGLNGYFKMSQDWFTDGRRLVDDMWVIRKT